MFLFFFFFFIFHFSFNTIFQKHNHIKYVCISLKPIYAISTIIIIIIIIFILFLFNYFIIYWAEIVTLWHIYCTLKPQNNSVTRMETCSAWKIEPSPVP